MRRLIILFLLVAATALAQCPVGYGYKRTITVNTGQVSGGPHANFPMLVLNPAASLKTVANGGHVQNANGYDILFVNGGGTTLPFELVGHGGASSTYSPSSGNAEFWVNVASLADGSAIYMCYGNSGIDAYQGNDTGTWSSSYKSVFHLPTSGSLSLADSTSNANHGTNYSATAAAGQIGGALNVTGSQYAGTANSLTLTNFTLEAWINGVYADATHLMIIAAAAGGCNTYLDVYNRTLFGKTCLTNHFGNTTLAGSVWHHVAMVYNGSTVAFYLNGAADGSSGESTNPGANDVFQLGALNGSLNFNGKIDEARIVSSALSAGWIQTEYRNQSAPNTFYAVSAESSLAASLSISPAAIPANHTGNITLTLTGTGTAWNAGTVFNLSGPADVVKVSQSVASATSATLVLTTGAATGTVTLTESVTGAASGTTTVSAPALSLNYSGGNLNSTQTLSLTGSNTVWSQETPTGLFTVTGGSGASLSAPILATDTSGNILLTVGTLAGTLTVRDTSTGATATFIAGGGGSGSGACAVVWAQ